VLRWGARVGGAFVGLLLMVSVIVGTRFMLTKDPARQRVTGAIYATEQLRAQLGRDAHIKVRELEDDGTDDNLELTVQYPANTPAPERKELYAGTNIVVRRHMPHVRTVKVVFGEEALADPSGTLDDGGTAVRDPSPAPTFPAPPTPAPSAPAAQTGKKPAAAAPLVRKGPTGTLTLVTFPEAKVLKGGTALGTTPLFNVELPPGTHLLTLVGADGSKHALSVMVKAGKNTPLKVNLADIPNSR
jgi:hypothetical protein